MKRVSFVSLLALGAVGYSAVLIQGCGDDVKLCDNGACDAPLDGSTDVTTTDSPGQPDAPNTDDGSSDGGGDGTITDAPPDTAPPGCEPTKDPKDSTPCVSDKYGLFVDASKPAGGTGAKASPFNTITAALTAAATATQKRIYVCEGMYAEPVSVTSAISIYGGWKCADWSYTGTKAKVAPTAVGYALSVANVATALVIEDLEFDAMPGTTASPSSIAAFVNVAAALTLRRVNLVAGAGAPGADQTQPAGYAARNADGNSGTSAAGGAVQSCTCATGGAPNGGKGGDPPSNGGNAGAPVAGGGVPGGGGGNCSSVGAGGIGGPGTAGTSGPNAIAGAALGTLDATGWHVAPGVIGTAGTPGGGGGGGGSRGGGGAGGGGCGGCGGAGGPGGPAGGASIALITVSSTVTLVASSLAAVAGGVGGKGALGQVGQDPGTGGGGSAPAPVACGGGDGAKGGNGGAGAGGAGGLSIGVFYMGNKPSLDGATQGAITRAASGGAGGAGPGAVGRAGVAADVQDVSTL